MSEDMYMVERILTAFLTYVLVVLRCGCLVLFAPFFSSETFFSTLRIIFAITFPLLFVPFAARSAVTPDFMEMQDLILLAGQEFAFGMTIAFLGTFIFTGVQMAGEIAGQQIGFSMANVMDPQSGIEMPLLGLINMNMALILFLVSKLHLVTIYIMAKSYEWVPIGAMLPDVNFNNPLLEMTAVQAGAMMRLGAQLAIPMMMIMLMNSVVEGFVTKTMPQMNIQVLGIPLRVVVGLTVLNFFYPAIIMMLVPEGYVFGLHSITTTPEGVEMVTMPGGPLSDMLTEISDMVRAMGEATPGR